MTDENKLTALLLLMLFAIIVALAWPRECQAQDEDWNPLVVFPSSQPLDDNERYGTDTSEGNDWYLDRPKREATIVTPLTKDITVIQRGMDIQRTTTCVNVEGTIICQ